MPKIQYIDPAQAAHNIATAFCQCRIQKLPPSTFDARSMSSSAAVTEIWNLYANVYDYIFESAVAGNESSIEEE